jgi:hypothetical protein
VAIKIWQKWREEQYYIFIGQQLAHLEPGRQITPIILRSRRNRYDLIICLFSQPKSSEILFAKFVPLSLMFLTKLFDFLLGGSSSFVS